jgi:hypothetical protein
MDARSLKLRRRLDSLVNGCLVDVLTIMSAALVCGEGKDRGKVTVAILCCRYWVPVHGSYERVSHDQETYAEVLWPASAYSVLRTVDGRLRRKGRGKVRTRPRQPRASARVSQKKTPSQEGPSTTKLRRLVVSPHIIILCLFHYSEKFSSHTHTHTYPHLITPPSPSPNYAVPTPNRTPCVPFTLIAIDSPTLPRIPL